MNHSSNWQGALEDPLILRLYCNSLAVQNIYDSISSKATRNRELEFGTEVIPAAHNLIWADVTISTLD